RDDEVSGRKAEQHQYQRLAFPAREQVLEHGDRALARVAAPCDLSVNRQRTKYRDGCENHRGDRCQSARGEEGDPWLIAERREVVDASQPYDFPPGMVRSGRPPGVIVQRLALRQPSSDRGSVFERGSWQLLPEGEALHWFLQKRTAAAAANSNCVNTR